jgi:[ribosomal protein S5]-alanine N-acetyltransferase
MAVISLNRNAFNSFPNLNCERFYLTQFRSNEVSDQASCFRLRSDPSILRWMDMTPFTSQDEAHERILQFEDQFGNQEAIQWAIRSKETGEVIGATCFWNIRFDHCRAEIGYSLMPEFWRKGVMFEVATKILCWGKHELNLHSVDANINPLNDPSRKLLLKLGFEREAYHRQNFQHNGIFLDSEIYGKIL